ARDHEWRVVVQQQQWHGQTCACLTSTLAVCGSKHASRVESVPEMLTHFSASILGPFEWRSKSVLSISANVCSFCPIRSTHCGVIHSRAQASGIESRIDRVIQAERQ